MHFPVIIYNKMKRNPLADVMTKKRERKRERERKRQDKRPVKSISYRFSLKRIIKHRENDAYNYAAERTNNGSLITQFLRTKQPIDKSVI